MIPVTPRPGLCALLSPACPASGGKVDPETLAAPWAPTGLDEKIRTVWFSRSAWAMVMLARLAAHLAGKTKNKTRVKVWLPDYFCNDSTQLLRRDADVAFYPVDANLDPRWETCNEMATRLGPPDLFILVHYFGHACDGAGARSFCDDTGALLAEDAAHVLRPVPGVGEAGDFVFYSPHKLLPVSDGAVLVMKSTVFGVEEICQSLGRKRAPFVAWWAKRMIQNTLPDPLMPAPASRLPENFADDPGPEALPNAPRLSLLAEYMLAGSAARLAAAAQTRRENAAVLAKALGGRAKWTPLLDFGEFEAPYRLPMLCNEPEIATERYREFRDRGVPVESWPDLPPEVLADPQSHEQATRLRRRVLFFPVHQGLDRAALLRLIG